MPSDGKAALCRVPGRRLPSHTACREPLYHLRTATYFAGPTQLLDVRLAQLQRPAMLRIQHAGNDRALLVLLPSKDPRPKCCS